MGAEIVIKNGFFEKFDIKEISLLHVIEYLVALAFNINPDLMREKNDNGKFDRHLDNAIPRYIAMGMSRLHTDHEFYSFKKIANHWECDHTTVMHHTRKITINDDNNTWMIDPTYGRIVQQLDKLLKGEAHLRMLEYVRNDKRPKLPKVVTVHVPTNLVRWYMLDSLYDMDTIGVGFLPCFVELAKFKKHYGEDADYRKIKVTTIELQRNTNFRRDQSGD